jgi:hypothetical protein
MKSKTPALKVYVFDFEKLRRVAHKYGYELFTKLPTSLCLGGVYAPESMEKEEAKHGENTPLAPLQLGKLGNLVTNGDRKQEPAE